jgi:hypothetical protein
VPVTETRAATALDACERYDHWASEIARLKQAIASCRCPHEWPPRYWRWNGEPSMWADDRPDAPSCFAREQVRTVCTGMLPDDGYRRVWLSEIAAAVKDCEACSRLCALIAERREARKQWGIAKRRIRAVGRARSNGVG